jgi:hypothetical protein
MEENNMDTLALFLIYEMIFGSVLGYVNDTVHKVPSEVRQANLTGKVVNKTLIQLGWKLIRDYLLEELV